MKRLLKKLKNNPKWIIIIIGVILIAAYIFYLDVQKICGCLPPDKIIK